MTGILPNFGFGLIDGSWLRALAGGGNRSYVNGLTAHAGGTKAAAFQIPSGVALVGFGTVATNGDSGLLPTAKAGTKVRVYNAGAATLSLYGKGTDTVNGVATATSYDLTTKQAADFSCDLDGHWSALKSA